MVGVALGIAVGAVLARVAFWSRSPSLRLAERGEPLLALAALVTAYGVAEVAGGYGFLAVFACAMTFRSAERHHHYHRAMHEVVERLERLFTLIILLVLGVAITRGLLNALDLRGVAIGLALIFLVRPVAAYVSLAVRARPSDSPGGLRRGERAAVAFFGVRGVGSLYYLAYALGQLELAEEAWLWSTVGFTVVASVRGARRHVDAGDEPPRAGRQGAATSEHPAGGSVLELAVLERALGVVDLGVLGAVVRVEAALALLLDLLDLVLGRLLVDAAVAADLVVVAS